MTRYVCTVAVGVLLALAGSGTAAAGLPLVGDTQVGTQTIGFGDQTIGEQKNDADVTQAQGNGNVNVSPAVAIFGDASTSNAQGNDNVAVAKVDQSNTATQTQSAQQQQTLVQDGSSGACCDGASQSGEQKVYGGDQSIGEQKNDADVQQYQGNGNVNVSPAIAVFGDASTSNSQGNGNVAVAKVDQSNQATQNQWASQSQNLDQNGGSCCDGQSQAGEQKTHFGDQTIDKQKNDADVEQYQGNGNVNVSPAISIFGDSSTWNSQGNGNVAIAKVDQSNQATQSQWANQQQDLSQQGGCCGTPHDCTSWDGCKPRENHCCDGQSQTGEQKAHFGDQTIGKQKNDADVSQYQGNKNVNVSPAIAFPHVKRDGCSKESYGRCGGSYWPEDGGASTWNAQGDGNFAFAGVDQSNSATQSQSAAQSQSLVQGCCEAVTPW